MLGVSLAPRRYAGLELLVEHPLFNGHAQAIVEFKDRYQAPAPGGYSDCELKVRVAGHLCELRCNVREMVDAKQADGHAVYEARAKGRHVSALFYVGGWWEGDGDAAREFWRRARAPSSAV